MGVLCKYLVLKGQGEKGKCDNESRKKRWGANERMSAKTKAFWRHTEQSKVKVSWYVSECPLNVFVFVKSKQVTVFDVLVCSL